MSPTTPMPVERATGVHRGRTGGSDRAIDLQHTAIHGGAARIGVDARRMSVPLPTFRASWSRDCNRRDGIANDAADLRRQIVAANDERIAPANVIGAAAFDRTGGNTAVAVRPTLLPKSTKPVPVVMKRALPPVELSENSVSPPFFVMIVALAADANAPKLVRPSASLKIVALPAVAVSVPTASQTRSYRNPCSRSWLTRPRSQRTPCRRHSGW